MAVVDDMPVRRRILDAAFSAFIEAGYAATTTLEIARRARVSKRELYAVVGNKQEMLVACIRERSARLRPPDDLPEPHDRDTLERVLVAARHAAPPRDDARHGRRRLPAGDRRSGPRARGRRGAGTHGRKTGHAALAAIMTKAQANGVLDGRPPDMVEQFAGLLWGDLMTSLLLRVGDPPTPEEITRRAERAAAAFLLLHPDRDR